MTRSDLAAVIGDNSRLQTALAAVSDADLSSIVSQAEAATTAELWDREQDINGVAARTVLKARRDIPKNGAILLIKVNGHVRQFQPHDPDRPGFVAMDLIRANTLGARLLAEVRVSMILGRLEQAAGIPAEPPT